MPALDLSILIVNWNSANYVRDCLSAIPGAVGSLTYEVIVIDNASFDRCGDMLRADFHEVRFVQSDRNLGFGGANNLLARMSSAPVLLFLNPDTAPSAHAFERMWRHLQEGAGAGLVGCRLRNTDGTIQTSCVQAMPTVLNQTLDADLLRRLTPRLKLWGTSALHDTTSAIVDVEAVSGACMMVRRSVFELVDGFSAAFFMYGEDVDLCARVSAAGFSVRHVVDAEVVHHGGGSSRHAPSRFSVVMMCESVSVLIRRHRGARSAATYRAALIVASIARLGILLVSWPFWTVSAGVRRWTGAWHKWTAVLRWGLGLPVRGAPVRLVVPTDRGL